MISETALIILGWIFFISTLAYGVSLFTIIALLKKTYPDYWQRIGSPSFLDPNSLKTIFPKIVFGRDLPTQAVTRYRLCLWTLRVSLSIGIAVWLLLMIIIIQSGARK